MTTSPALTRSQLAAMIDHTLLAPEATPKDIHALCAEAKTLGVHAVCVSPTLTTVAALGVAGSFVRVAAVAGFPSGAHNVRLKAERGGRGGRDRRPRGRHGHQPRAGRRKAAGKRLNKRSPPSGARRPAPPC